jgi:hypothetical protein
MRLKLYVMVVTYGTTLRHNTSDIYGLLVVDSICEKRDQLAKPRCVVMSCISESMRNARRCEFENAQSSGSLEKGGGGEVKSEMRRNRMLCNPTHRQKIPRGGGVSYNP